MLILSFNIIFVLFIVLTLEFVQKIVVILALISSIAFQVSTVIILSTALIVL